MSLHRAPWIGGGLVLVANLLVRPAASCAHAFLERADPAVGSTVRGSPSTLALRFTGPIEPAFSSLQLLGPGDKPIDAGAVGHPREDELSLSLPALPPGTYVVRWKVVSVDTHETEGSFRFTVMP